MSYLNDMILFNFIYCNIYRPQKFDPVTTTNMKDILKKTLSAGSVPALELLYYHYGGMLFSYILQFVPGKTMAGTQLVCGVAKTRTISAGPCGSVCSSSERIWDPLEYRVVHTKRDRGKLCAWPGVSCRSCRIRAVITAFSRIEGCHVGFRISAGIICYRS